MANTAVLIHGLMDRLAIPVALEHDGKLHDVVAYRARLDLQTAHWRQEPRSYWDVQLDTGDVLTVYRELNRGRWFAVR